jgi:hypothetical protein
MMSAMHRSIELLRRVQSGSDRFALVVTAERDGRRATMGLSGRRQADATADAAAELARSLVTGAIDRAGVWLPEQVVEPEAFLSALDSTFAWASRQRISDTTA